MNFHITAPYKVISHSPEDGILVDHFETRAEADAFARVVAEEGYTAMVCLVTTIYQPDEQPREVVAAPGINFPASLTRPQLGTVTMPQPAA